MEANFSVGELWLWGFGNRRLSISDKPWSGITIGPKVRPNRQLVSCLGPDMEANGLRQGTYAAGGYEGYHDAAVLIASIRPPAASNSPVFLHEGRPYHVFIPVSPQIFPSEVNAANHLASTNRSVSFIPPGVPLASFCANQFRSIKSSLLHLDHWRKDKLAECRRHVSTFCLGDKKCRVRYMLRRKVYRQEYGEVCLSIWLDRVLRDEW